MSISVSDERNRKDERGYTYVDHGLARVGNRWLERVWSGFMGHTTSLMQKSGDVEWAAPKSPEFSLDVDGSRLGVDHFGEIEWSEECNELGATLVATHRCPGLELRVEQLAFHDAPGLLRTTTIFNRGRRKVKVGPFITESFELDEPECCQYFMCLKASGEQGTSAGFDQIGAVVAGERGLILLGERNAEIVLGSEDFGACSVRIDDRQILTPSQFATQDRSLLIAFEGDSQAALDRHLPEILLRMRLHDRMMAKRALEDD